MQPADLHPHEQARLAALQRYEILDSDAEGNFDELTELASEICETPISLISLVDKDRQWFKSRIGLDASETDRSLAFCAHAIHGQSIFEVPNALEDGRFADNPLVTSAPDIRFYAGAPLMTKEGLPLGTLCVIDRKPKSLNAHQKRSLEILAHQVVSQLDLRLHQRKLLRINKTQSQVFSLIAHDLRSPFNGLLGLSKRMATKSDKLNRDQLTDAAFKIHHSATSAYQLLEELLEWSQHQWVAREPEFEKLDLLECVTECLSFFESQLQMKNLRVETQAEASLSVTSDSTIVKSILRNLLANAIKFSPRDEAIHLLISKTPGQVCVGVENKGEVLSRELKEKLFRSRMDSRQGTEMEEGHGLGLLLCKDFVTSLNGEIWMDEECDDGVRIWFCLPEG